MAQDNGHVSQDDESDGVPPEFPERLPDIQRWGGAVWSPGNGPP